MYENPGGEGHGPSLPTPMHRKLGAQKQSLSQKKIKQNVMVS